MTTPKPLSPAAQAVKDAVLKSYDSPDQIKVELYNVDIPRIVGALRALVKNHATPTRGGAVILSGEDVLAIAAELEAQCLS